MSWEVKPLEELCEVFTDGDWIESKDQSPEGIRLVQTGNIGEGVFKDREDKARFISKATFARLNCTEVFEGDCLVSRLPDPVGRACILPDTGKQMITGVDCSIIRFKQKAMKPEFFQYYSQSDLYLNDVAKLISGTTRDRISRKNLGSVPVPIPPLPEQQRIVGKLDAAFAALTEAQAHVERNRANARELFESFLNGVFEGKHEDWLSANLKAVTTKIGSGATPRGGEAAYKQEGVPLIRSLNVHDLAFRYERLSFLDEAQAEDLSNVVVQKGDVLLNITGASVARSCVVPDDVLPARVNQHVAIVRPVPEKLDPRFLHFMLISKAYKERLLQTGEEGGSTRQAITKAQLQEFCVAYPATLREQTALVSQLNEILSESQQLETTYQQKLSELAGLKKAVLGAAFRGEL